MGVYSIWHWLIILAVVVILFGGKRVAKTINEIRTALRGIERNKHQDDHHDND